MKEKTEVKKVTGMCSYLRQVDKLLSRDGEELEVGSVGHDVTDKVLDVVNVPLDVVEVGQLALLVLKDLVGLLQPGLERAHLGAELDKLLQG